MGSGGLLQKGLDIALEAFLGMPELKLTVCGPTLNEPRFMEVYAKSLRDCGNIEILGWVDVGSKTFEDLRLRSLAIVYPSSTEGQAGAVINCMRAGLIPIVSKETGVDVDGFGEMLAGCSVEQVQKTVRAVSSCSAAELERRARGAWCYAERFHSHESYIAQYDSIIRNIIKKAEKRPESV